MILTLKKTIEEAAIEINAAKLRIFARINPPENLLDDETYFVDQKASEFLVRYGNKTAFRSPLQIVGTWSHSEESFLWSWYNSSIDEKNFLELKEKMSVLPELTDALQQKSLSGESSHFFFELSTWIGLHCGYQGVYPASYEGEVTAYLAVNLQPVDRDDSGRICVMCMGRQHQADYFVASSDEFGTCSRCIGTLMDIVASDDETGESILETLDRKCASSSGSKAFTPCQLCQTKAPEVPVVAGPHTEICYQCIRLLADIHLEKNG